MFSMLLQAKCFGQARGASFNDELEYEVGTAIAKEVIAGGANYFAGIWTVRKGNRRDPQTLNPACNARSVVVLSALCKQVIAISHSKLPA